MVKVKICGITRIEDLELAVSAGADMLGFVVNVPSSLRNLSRREATRLISLVPSGVESVAVTVIREFKDLAGVIELDADYVQLHGDPLLLIKIAGWLSSKRVIGAVNARLPNALELATEYSKLFRVVLVDSLRDGGLGGSGETHDWTLSMRIRNTIFPKPLILAGGLTPENVVTAVSTVKPYAVDVSTGVEARPGVKDPEKVFRFIERAKSVEE
jgi:phosphoribosylanthranilate isomerase